jgi:hypothetical protein
LSWGVIAGVIVGYLPAFCQPPSAYIARQIVD